MAGQCFIGLGSNLGDGPGVIRQALEKLGKDSAIEVKRVSSLYRSAAWGRTDQPDFTNAVAELVTTLSAIQLLQKLLLVEAELGRSRDTGHWGPRLIDIDLLTFGKELINEPDLVVPHPRIHERAFVLLPLLELEPEFEVPGLGSAALALKDVEDQSVRKVL